uniref:Uncharacterized protein n=1 Tax=Arundo donax TaxID=35708 RepID=A0A0A8ZG52_ARUDO
MQQVHPFLGLALHLAQHQLLLAPSWGPRRLCWAHWWRSWRRPITLLLLPFI